MTARTSDSSQRTVKKRSTPEVIYFDPQLMIQTFLLKLVRVLKGWNPAARLHSSL